jgi:hypothetical protein
LIRSALRQFEDNLFDQVTARLPGKAKLALDALLHTDQSEDEYRRSDVAELKIDGGKLGVKSILQETERLSQLRQVELPDDLFADLTPTIIEKYAQRVMAEAPRELRRHPSTVRYTLLACFCWQQRRQVTDSLVQLLIQIIHRMNTRAETKVKKTFIEDVVRVSGKQHLLYKLAQAALTDPEGSVRDVIFSVVGEETLHRVVKEFQVSGDYDEQVYRTLRVRPWICCNVMPRADKSPIPNRKLSPFEGSFVRVGSQWCSKRIPRDEPGSIASTMKWAFWTRCVIDCAARKSGSRVRITFVTRRPIYHRTLISIGSITMRHWVNP